MKAKTIRGPAGSPLVGRLPAFLADKLELLMRRAEECGGIVRLDFGGDDLPREQAGRYSTCLGSNSVRGAIVRHRTGTGYEEA
jgi:hypothetical protein